MALIDCEECGRQVSDKATACPNCGAPIGEIDTGYRDADGKPRAPYNWEIKRDALTAAQVAESRRIAPPTQPKSASGCGVFWAVVGALLFVFIGLPIILALLGLFAVAV